MLKIALCDDDMLVYSRIKDLLNSFSIRFNNEYSLTYYPSPDLLLKSPFDYHVLIMELKFEDKSDGIFIGKRLREMGNRAVFIIITSQANRAIEGYKINTFRYILKPITQESLDEAIFATLRHLQTSMKILPVRFRQNIDYVHKSDIIMIQSYMRKRYIFTKNTCLQTSDTWIDIINNLKEDCFFQPQKTYLINFLYISSTTKRSVTMTNGQTINFARGRYLEFEARYSDYLHNVKLVVP